MMKKIISVLLSICLIETIAFGQGVAPVLPAAAANQRVIIQENAKIFNYSNVTSFMDLGSPFSVVIIQDLHCHPGVQKNISLILKQLYENYNVKNIFVEGAAGGINLDWLNSIADKSFADKAAESLIGSGRLTGSEYFAYKNKTQHILKGAEDREIHLRNLERLASIVEAKEGIREILAAAEKDLKQAQKENYGFFNKKLARLNKRHKEGAIDSVKYYKRLISLSRAINKNDGIFKNVKADIAKYPEITEYIDTISKIGKININAVTSQASLLINELKDTITYNRYNELIRKTDSFKDTQTLFEELLLLEKQGTINLSKYKELSLFIKSRTDSKHFNPIKLLESEKELLKSLMLAGARNEQEAVTVVLSELFDSYKNYYMAEISAEEYLYLTSFGIKRYKDYFSANISPENIGKLDRYYGLLKDYYEANISRDKIFIKHMEVFPKTPPEPCHSGLEKIFNSSNEPAPQGLNAGESILPSSNKHKDNVDTGFHRYDNSKNYEDILSGAERLDIIVCGGFHSDGLKKELEKRNISYAVITPKIEGDAKTANEIYENILLDSVKPLRHSIALQLLSQTGNSMQFRSIVESMLADELKQNPKLNVSEFIKETINAICAIDRAELELHGVTNYKRPRSEGIAANDDGTFTVSVFFDGRDTPEKIVLRNPKADYAGSIFGSKYARWEWVYMLPGVSFFTVTKWFASVLLKTVLRGKSDKFKTKKIESFKFESGLRKTLDIAGILMFALSPGITGLAVYIVTRALLFSSAHTLYGWKEDLKEKMILAGVYIIFSLPAILPFVLGGFTFTSLLLSLIIGIPANAAIHTLYNKLFPNLPALIFSPHTNFDKRKKFAEKNNMPIQYVQFKDGYFYAVQSNDHVNRVYKDIIAQIKRELAKKAGVSFQDIIVSHGINKGYSKKNILDMASVELYSYKKFPNVKNEAYFLDIDPRFLDFLSENKDFEREFLDNLDHMPGTAEYTPLHIKAVFEFKTYLLKKQLTIPSAADMKLMAENMLNSNYNFDTVNTKILKALKGLQYFENNDFIKYQFLEFLGYVIQSQTWLSPANANTQFGYLQRGSTPATASYERELANFEKFEKILEKMFLKNAAFVKSKEAAFYEYIRKTSDASSSFILPKSLLARFTSIEPVSSDRHYYSDSEENFMEILERTSPGKDYSRYLVIDCSKTDNVQTAINTVNEYNKTAKPSSIIKKIMFYDAKPEHYPLITGESGYETEFIFDFPSFLDFRNAGIIPMLFTETPAVYVSNNLIVTDYGSRFNNFTLQYLHILLSGIQSENLIDFQDDKKRYSSMPSHERIKEYSVYYADLIFEFKQIRYLDGIRNDFMKILLEHAKNNAGIISNAESSAQELNRVIDEYRTLLNYSLYFKWSDIKYLNYKLSDEGREDLASVYNSKMRKPRNSANKEAAQETLLVTSGMSAFSVIMSFLSAEGADKIAIGNHQYYENTAMFEKMGAITDKRAFFELDIDEILRLQRQKTDAIFIDLISNSVSKANTSTYDILAADINRIVSELSKATFDKPFYVCIDNSMYPSFQFADIFDGIDLPDNLNIVIYGSMQKLHQRGLEINTAGFLTLISYGSKHGEQMRKLKEAVKFTSSELDEFRYVSMREFLLNNYNLNEYSARLNNSAEEFALLLNEMNQLFGERLVIAHPLLYDEKQKQIWENNSKPGIPFFFIRGNAKHEREPASALLAPIFINYLKDNLQTEGFFDYLQRDSYGFPSLTTIFYTAGQAYRFNIGNHSEENKEKIKKALIKTFTAYADFSDTKEKEGLIDSIYEFLKKYEVSNLKINKTAEESILRLISDYYFMKEVNTDSLLKAASICVSLGVDIPQNIKSEINNLLSNYKDLSQDKMVLLISLFKYIIEFRSDISKKSAPLWVSGTPREQAMAARNIVDMAVKDDTHAPDTTIPVIRNDSIINLLSAA